MQLDPTLLEILACPNCHAPLRVAEGPAAGTEELVCTSDTCGLAYPVRDEIPVLLIDEARRPHATPNASGPDSSSPSGKPNSSPDSSSADAP